MRFRKPRSLHQRLSDSAPFEAEIERIHGKLLLSNVLYQVAQDGVSFATLSLHRRRVAALLAKEVSLGTYRFQPAIIGSVMIEEKMRDLYRFRPTDRIVHGALARVLAVELAPHLSRSVHSYQRGKGWWDGVNSFARYLRSYCRRISNPKDRGLYVLKRDIRQYTDSIPVGKTAPLWEILRKILAKNHPRETLPAQHWSLIQAAVRPVIEDSPEVLYSRTRGIPTGSPIASVLYNLCAMPLDQALSKIPGAFYSRYSDDFIFAHPNPAIVKQAGDTMVQVLESLGLELNRAKERTFYFTGAGAPSREWPEATPTSSVTYLGCTISFQGMLSLKKKKARRFLRDIRARAARTAEITGRTCIDRTGRLICSALNQALDVDSYFRPNSSRLLRLAVTDRGQLKHLDRLIELIVAETVSGVAGPRAFRVIPPHKIRGEWRLLSLYHERNQVK